MSKTYDEYVCMFFRSFNMRMRMGVVGSPKEGMLNRSPGTWEGGGPSTDCCHLHIILSIYYSSDLSFCHVTIYKSVIVINLDDIESVVLFISHFIIGLCTQ